jgi:hypothetical protein
MYLVFLVLHPIRTGVKHLAVFIAKIYQFRPISEIVFYITRFRKPFQTTHSPVNKGLPRASKGDPFGATGELIGLHSVEGRFIDF